MNKFKLIKSKKRLTEVIIFLQKGFNWNYIRNKKLFETIINFNKTIKIYGAEYVDKNDNLLGAMLFFYQGEIIYENKLKKILNLSSWYFIPENRGPDTILFINNVVKSLQDFVLTNYTANHFTGIIYKKINFDLIKIVKLRINFISLIKNIMLNLSIPKKNNLHLIYLSNNNFEYSELKSLKIHTNEGAFEIVYSTFRKSFLVFSLSSVSIRWSNNYNLLMKYKYKIALKLLILNKSLFVNFFIPQEFINLETSEYWAFYGTNEPLKIPPLRSELSVG